MSCELNWVREFRMATFAGTTQKCKACEKTVYLVDQLTADNKVYHKACFRCHHCKGTLKVYLSFSLSYELSNTYGDSHFHIDSIISMVFDSLFHVSDQFWIVLYVFLFDWIIMNRFCVITIELDFKLFCLVRRYLAV